MESPEFDILAQDVYIVSLEETIKHIQGMLSDFDISFLQEALDEQRATLKKMSITVEVIISFPIEDKNLDVNV